MLCKRSHYNELIYQKLFEKKDLHFHLESSLHSTMNTSLREIEIPRSDDDVFVAHINTSTLIKEAQNPLQIPIGR